MKLEFNLSYTRLDRGVKKGMAPAFTLNAQACFDGQFHLLSGPSGAGKTTFLNLIAGTLSPQHGTLHLDGKCLINTQDQHFVSAMDRKIAYVFQDDLLFPHLNVQRNIEYGWDGIAPRWDSLKPLSITDLHARMPHELSGGESRRVAIARALMRRPNLLLLDEPFTGLNETLKQSLSKMLHQLSEELGFAILIVTHEQSAGMNFPMAYRHQIEHGKLGRITEQ